MYTKNINVNKVRKINIYIKKVNVQCVCPAKTQKQTPVRSRAL